MTNNVVLNKIINMKKKPSKPTILSLFSGAGGLDYGLMSAGAKVVLAVDNDKDCFETYKLNIGNHIKQEDISNVTIADLPETDVVIGGFPCQGFSVANKFRNKLDTRNKLYVEMLRIIKGMRPKWVIAENVKGILSLDKGNVIKSIIKEISDIGYVANYKLFNMADFGVPQIRERVFIFGTRSDLYPYSALYYPEPTYSKNGNSLKKWVTVNEAFKLLNKCKKPLKNNIGSSYKVEIRDFTGHRMTNGNKPSPTILARGNGKGGVNATPHPNGKRRMTVRESAAIQTFPDDFRFCGSMTSMYRQIGNAVPVLFSEIIGEKLIDAYKRYKNRPKTVSLFTGAGGMDLGFKTAGFNIIYAIDNDYDSVETYRKNIDNHIVFKSIEEVDLNTIPKSDIIIGGFPCQGFSVANTKRSIDDTRNILYKHFVKIVSIKKPKFFLAENVKGILSLGKGLVFNKILEDFSNAGYSCNYALLNAADYGLPQLRERVFILGVRKGVKAKIKFPPEISHSEKAFKRFKERVTIGEALNNIPDPDSVHNLSNHVYSKFKLKFNNYIGHRKVDPRKPSPTLTARGDLKGGAVIIHHPSNKRRLTCREAAIIQGFPIDYEFCGNMSSVYKQVANAVPPPLANKIAKEIFDSLALNKKSTDKCTSNTSDSNYKPVAVQRTLAL